MKTCFKCLRTLPLSGFYAHSRMADGYLNKCRECTRRDVQENREKKVQQYRAYDRSRHADGRHVQTRDADRHRARVHVHNATRRGHLTRQPCEVCGAMKVEAHHEDYSKPLAVRWLCRTHHGMVHRIDAERRPF